MSTANPSDIILEWQGPYEWFGEGVTSIFSGPSAESCGIYVWTVPIGTIYRVFYIGQTAKGLATRHHDHFREYFGGAYSFYSPQEFVAGQLKYLYSGYAYRKPRWRYAVPFHERFIELIDPLLANLRAMRIWLAPLERPARIQRRIETALMQVLYERGDAAGRFLQPGLHLEPRRDGEVPFSIMQSPSGLLEGIPEYLIA